MDNKFLKNGDIIYINNKEMKCNLGVDSSNLIWE